MTQHLQAASCKQCGYRDAALFAGFTKYSISAWVNSLCLVSPARAKAMFRLKQLAHHNQTGACVSVCLPWAQSRCEKIGRPCQWPAPLYSDCPKSLSLFYPFDATTASCTSELECLASTDTCLRHSEWESVRVLLQAELVVQEDALPVHLKLSSNIEKIVIHPVGTQQVFEAAGTQPFIQACAVSGLR